MNIIANEINTEVSSQIVFPGTCRSGLLLNPFFVLQETLVFLTVGEEKGPGLFLLAGPSKLVTDTGSQ